MWLFLDTLNKLISFVSYLLLYHEKYLELLSKNSELDTHCWEMLEILGIVSMII